MGCQTGLPNVATRPRKPCPRPLPAVGARHGSCFEMDATLILHIHFIASIEDIGSFGKTGHDPMASRGTHMTDMAIARAEAEGTPNRRSAAPRKWWIVFKHRTAVFCLLLVLVHQSIVACSTIFLTATITRFQSGQGYFTELCLYLMAMALPYLPGCASFVLMQRWINVAHHALVEDFTNAAASNSVDYRDVSTREDVTAVLARNSAPVIKDYISFIHDLASFSLNSVLSIVVIVFLLPSQLAAGYCVSLALCFVIVVALRKGIGEASSRCEYAYLRYSGVLSGFWPNVVLGNTHNESIWRSQRESTGASFYATSNRLELFRQFGNVLLAAASLGPTIFLIIALARSNTADPALVAALIVSLTRIFLIVNSLSALVYRVLDYSSLHARVKVLLDALDRMSHGNSKAVATSIDVSVNGVQARDVSEVKGIVTATRFGRFTITGDNGSGKSTAILALKQEYGAACFLLPSDYSHLAWKKNGHSLSTGQRLVEHLAEIFQIESIQYILLDEWDANLDQNNTQRIDNTLSLLAAKKVIVEVRHKRTLP